MDARGELLALQSGAISRRQLLAVGCAPHDIQRMLRRRELSMRSPGVYLHHTGEPTWIERAWLALLAVSSDIETRDVALAHWSALRVAEGPGRRDGRDDRLHVAIAHDRRARGSAGIVVHRMRHLADRRHPRRMPPRIRYEEAILDVASDLDDFDALGVITRAVGGRYSTASRLLAATRGRSRMHRRAWIQNVLIDVEQGTPSVLESAFLDRVVRPHALPVPDRQRRAETAIGVVYRDAVYRGLAVELDGRIHHAQWRQRAADLDRDLQAAVSGLRTIRLGWGQVVGRPCRTAAALAVLIGNGRRCAADCAVVRRSGNI